MSALIIRQAQPGEFDLVLGLLEESVRWLRSRGFDQWSTWPQWRAKMQPSLERGDVWLLLAGQQPIGTITIETNGDTDFWSPSELQDPAVYLSKLAVSRGAAGNEYGALLLEWAGDRAYRHGHAYLRLDAWKSNEHLQSYYRRRGWEYLRTSLNASRRSGALFQRLATQMSFETSAALQEVPAPPALETERYDSEVDPVGNFARQHTHIRPGLIARSNGLDQYRMGFVPGYRYRLREESGAWQVEQSYRDTWYQTATVTGSDLSLTTGSLYVITHQDTQPCYMSMVEIPRSVQ
ncbi:GNAT family N-acetyltransferase [Polymorphospora sp. NPDC050346]|uniref:GNAT family N-acetyltransferase n=1 Tax=Polymorphospora sp. NPDC050346 TaxID=3155780 RepID=UPI0033FEEF8F